MHDSSIETPSRTLRYSGSERPACRMNQTGTCGTGSPRAALRNAEEATSGAVGTGDDTAQSSQVRRRVGTSAPGTRA